MIEFKDVTFSYNDNYPILSDINLKIKDNESIGIIGANGVGKSTFLKLLVGIELGYRGNIIIDELKMEKKNLSKIREKIGYVFQDSDNQLFMPTIYEDVAFAPRNYGFSKEEVNKRTEEALKSVEIEKLKDKPIYHLSGGEKKLASIATILSMKPEILIFDDPTVALDPRNRRKFIEVLNSLKGTKIVTSHDLDLIYDSCDRTILIANGKIIKDGETKEILNNKELLENNGLELPLSLIRRN